MHRVMQGLGSMVVGNSPSHLTKWRLSFKSSFSRQVVQLVDLYPSAPFAESLKALDSAHSGNADHGTLGYHHYSMMYLVIQDNIISEVSDSKST
jgi:hypothetical protein